MKNQMFWVNWGSFLQKLPLGRAWQKFTSGIRPSAQETFLNFSALSNPKPDMYGDYLRMMDINLSSYKSALDFDRQVYLVQDVLKIHDNTLMAHGIEGRSPYLDNQLIQLWKRVADPVQILGKPWIGSCLEDLNLKWIRKRKKTGFGLPLLEWFGENGPFAKKVFATLGEFGKTFKTELPADAFKITQHPKIYTKEHFLVIYNLFLFAEWLKLQKQ
jgi:asparagine synthase (glutamine-hydrolysing)